MNDWWTDLDRDILDCLGSGRALTPADIGGRLGLSEGAVSSVLSMLVNEGKVRICLVASARRAEDATGPARARARSRSRAAMAS
jgi:DNA-binding CsgD family transcriptional regulator